mmetsp:Transcript_96076/g.170505  ORF Transcript_96076/g.170505 Transcript_96076/m.170505 type:complete len:223 (-) Transcript_96076:719-1387(-)
MLRKDREHVRPWSTQLWAVWISLRCLAPVITPSLSRWPLPGLCTGLSAGASLRGLLNLGSPWLLWLLCFHRRLFSRGCCSCLFLSWLLRLRSRLLRLLRLLRLRSRLLSLLRGALFACRLLTPGGWAASSLAKTLLPLLLQSPLLLSPLVLLSQLTQLLLPLPNIVRRRHGSAAWFWRRSSIKASRLSLEVQFQTKVGLIALLGHCRHDLKAMLPPFSLPAC